jgi:hypothetical protein
MATLSEKAFTTYHNGKDRQTHELARRFASPQFLRRGLVAHPSDATSRVLKFDRVFVITSFLSPLREMKAGLARTEDCCTLRETDVD